MKRFRTSPGESPCFASVRAPWPPRPGWHQRLDLARTRSMRLPAAVSRLRRRARIHEPTSVTFLAEEAAPAPVGVPAGAIAAIWAAVLDFYRTGLQPGMALCIRRRGAVVLHR